MLSASRFDECRLPRLLVCIQLSTPTGPSKSSQTLIGSLPGFWTLMEPALAPLPPRPLAPVYAARRAVPRLVQGRLKLLVIFTVPAEIGWLALSEALNAENVPKEPATPRAPMAPAVIAAFFQVFMVVAVPLSRSGMEWTPETSAARRGAREEIREKRVRTPRERFRSRAAGRAAAAGAG